MVFFEENRASDLPLDDVVDALFGFFPDIEKEDIKFFYHGTYNVFEVKNQYIFRIPDKVFRNLKGVKLIQNEVKMLHHIQKYVSVSIPDPLYISIDPECPFMGYKKLEGTPLSQCFNEASKNVKVRVAREIGEFLSELHSDKLFQEALGNQIVKSSFSCKIYREKWERYFEKIQSTIFKSMDSTQKKWIINLFTSFLNEQENFNFKYTIIHGDFDITNIIVDPITFKLTGIVDFEESRIYDPAADFIFYDEGDIFLNEILSSYQGIIDKNFENRMKFLYGRSGLEYIDFGYENNISDMVEAGFQILRKAMKRFPI